VQQAGNADRFKISSNPSGQSAPSRYVFRGESSIGVRNIVHDETYITSATTALNLIADFLTAPIPPQFSGIIPRWIALKGTIFYDEVIILRERATSDIIRIETFWLSYTETLWIPVPEGQRSLENFADYTDGGTLARRRLDSTLRLRAEGFAESTGTLWALTGIIPPSGPNRFVTRVR